MWFIITSLCTLSLYICLFCWRDIENVLAYMFNKLKRVKKSECTEVVSMPSKEQMQETKTQLLEECSLILHWVSHNGTWRKTHSDSDRVQNWAMNLFQLEMTKKKLTSSVKDHSPYYFYKACINGQYKVNITTHCQITSSDEGDAEEFCHELLNNCPEILAAHKVWQEVKKQEEIERVHQEKMDVKFALEMAQRKHEKTLEALKTLSYYR